MSNASGVRACVEWVWVSVWVCGRGRQCGLGVVVAAAAVVVVAAVVVAAVAAVVVVVVVVVVVGGGLFDKLYELARHVAP